MQQLVSIIVPSYNYAAYLPATLNSALSQDYQAIEVIVIDDGSTDATDEIVANFKQVKYVRQENSGLSAARNKGIKIAQGSFLLFLDADDLLGKHSISSRVYHLLNNPDISIAICRNSIFHRVYGKFPLPTMFKGWPIPANDLATHLFFRNLAPPHGYLCRRSAIENTGYFDITLRACEDYDYWVRSLTCGNLFSLSPSGVVYYRKHPHSMSADLKNQLCHDLLISGRNIHRLANTKLLLAHKDRLQFIIAAVAGSFYTFEQYFSTFSKLPDNIESDINAILDLVSSITETITHPALTTTGRYYYLQLLLSYKLMKESYKHHFSHILEILDKRLRLLNQTQSPSKVLASLSKDALLNPKLNVSQRYRYLKNCFRYLL